MENIFSKKSENEIVISEGLFDYNWEPETIHHREVEIRTISSEIRPLLSNKKPGNLLIFGKPGVGKTLVLKKVLKDLKAHTTKVKTVFVNCWDYNKEYQIFGEISKQLDYPFFHGKSKSEIFKEIEKRVKSFNGAVFVFDEIDKAKEFGFLYSIIDNLPLNSCTILITNDKDFIYELEDRTLSRLNLNDLEFKPYDKVQIKEILEERINAGLRTGSLVSNQLLRIVNKSFDNQDLRTGLFLILQSARNAENDFVEKISVKHVSKAISDLYKFKIKTSLSKLGVDEKIIVDLVLDKNGLTTGELYTYYQNKGGKLTDRTFRRLINKLERLELLELKTTGKGFRGKTRIVSPGSKINYTKIE